eukprot:168523-Lingulodinium_polyedra.AAC.1
MLGAAHEGHGLPGARARRAAAARFPAAGGPRRVQLQAWARGAAPGGLGLRCRCWRPARPCARRAPPAA